MNAIYENEEKKYFYSKNDKKCIKKKSRMHDLNTIYSDENQSENNYENENSKKFEILNEYKILTLGSIPNQIKML